MGELTKKAARIRFQLAAYIELIQITRNEKLLRLQIELNFYPPQKQLHRFAKPYLFLNLQANLKCHFELIGPAC